MSLPLYQVDAFTGRPFTGNPAAVCLLPHPRPADWMQNVASEMNLAETAFLHPEGDGYGLRWFTPTVEVDLCGHATLASAHILWETGRLTNASPALFHTRSGLLTAVRRSDAVELDFPAEPESAAAPPSGLLDALGVTPMYVGRNRFDYLVQVESEAALRKLRPQFQPLAAVDCRGIIVTAPSENPQFDFVSRFFAPAAGVNEDPVTGSAHCCLAPFWQARLGKARMVGCQASTRGGIVQVQVEGTRVKLVGQAITVFAGELLA